jgi:hypothetical protein
MIVSWCPAGDPVAGSPAAFFLRVLRRRHSRQDHGNLGACLRGAQLNLLGGQLGFERLHLDLGGRDDPRRPARRARFQTCERAPHRLLTQLVEALLADTELGTRLLQP